MELVAHLATRDDFDSMMRLCRVNGESIADNRRQWDWLWSCDTTAGVTIHNLAADEGERICAITITTAVTDEFYETAISSYAPDLLERLRRTPSAAILGSQVSHINGGDGHNLLIAYMGWEGENYRQEPAPNLRAVLVNAYSDRHGGNRLKRLIGEVGGSALRDLSTRVGFQVINEYTEWAKEHQMEDAPKRPYLIGITRSEAMDIENQWIHRMFTYFPPVFAFTEHQRKILLLAREGLTDVEIGELLGVSTDAVKKRWSGIYERVLHTRSGILPESPLGGRGAEKRRLLLAHLRERPEELRGYERPTPTDH